ncbi:hypothetical protein M569_07593, partial [Genlisea aurea]
SSTSHLLYYGDGSGSVSVPFQWESQPGTPKHTMSCRPLPPLAPPPPYHRESSPEGSK